MPAGGSADSPADGPAGGPAGGPAASTLTTTRASLSLLRESTPPCHECHPLSYQTPRSWQQKSK